MPAGCEFPRDVLIATDAIAGSREVVAVAGALARRHDVRPILLHVGPAHRASRRELAEQATMLIEATGVEPVTLRVDGDPDQEFARLACELSTALLVVGRRRPDSDRTGPSVSARAVRSAPVPVLVVPVPV